MDGIEESELDGSAVLFLYSPNFRVALVDYLISWILKRTFFAFVNVLIPERGNESRQNI